MGNSGSFMEKVYIYLPVLMFHSRMDYGDPSTMWTMRAAYFAEQIVLFLFIVYFIQAIRSKKDEREIFVPDVSTNQVLMNTVPTTEEMKFRRTNYFQHEMTEAFQQLRQTFVAFMLTVVVHFILGIRPILLFQIFATPYNFIENRLLRKYVLGLQPGYRVWGERFDGELEGDKIAAGSEEASVVATAGGGGGGESEGLTRGAVGEAVPAVAATAPVVQGKSGDDETAVEAEPDMPMPKALEDKLIDAWDAAEDVDWSTVVEQLGPFSVNTRTPTGRWTPLMVACGLSKVGVEEIKMLVSDLDALVNLQDEDGWTCAHWAAQHGRPEAMRAVLDGLVERASESEAGSAAAEKLLSVRDNEGKTTAEVARAAGHEEGVLREFLIVLEGGVGGDKEGKEETGGGVGAAEEMAALD